jgi:prefoldin subunit 5
LEVRVTDSGAKAARSPVEATELSAAINSINRQIELLQQQIAANRGSIGKSPP